MEQEGALGAIVRGTGTVLEGIGTATERTLSDLGSVAILGVRVVGMAARPPYRFFNLLASCEAIGVGSMFVVVLTAFFTGAVFGMQSASAFALFDAQSLVGATV